MDRPTKTPAAHEKRVALVHHHALLREGLCRILEAGGFEVVWQGENGAGAVEQIQDHSPGVVLLEWEAPAVEPALIRRLADLPAEPVVVIITRPATPDDLSPALESGAAGCLSVNLGAQDFLAALRMLAQGGLLVSHEMVPAVTNPVVDIERPQDRLTERELEILRALGQGATNREIAEELFISPHTVKIHVRRILAKMGLRNRQQAAAYAAAEGLVPSPDADTSL